MGVKNLTPIKWPTVLVDEVKGKPLIFEAYFCVAHCILLFKHLSNHIHFITNGLQTLFKDQLDHLSFSAMLKINFPYNGAKMIL